MLVQVLLVMLATLKETRRNEVKICAKNFLGEFSFTHFFAQPDGGWLFAGDGEHRVYKLQLIPCS